MEKKNVESCLFLPLFYPLNSNINTVLLFISSIKNRYLSLPNLILLPPFPVHWSYFSFLGSSRGQASGPEKFFIKTIIICMYV